MAQFIGVVLAGGMSQRMGNDKAGLMWRGSSFLETMIQLLEKQGIKEIVILGKADHPLGIADKAEAVGPAVALGNFINGFEVGTKFLVVPVDMPYLTGDILSKLIKSDQSCHYEGEVLPALLTKTEKAFNFERLRDIISSQDAVALEKDADEAERFVTCNTQEELMAVRARFEAVTS